MRDTTASIRIAVAVLLAMSTALHASGERRQVMAPGWGELSYIPPAAGTYTLPPIKSAPDGQVLDTDNSPLRLHDLMGDKLVVLSFIYTHCGDANGCPLANAVLYSTQNRISQSPELVDSIRLISLSFDPLHDTSQAMSELGALMQRGNVDWEFLTTAGQDKLQPILTDYGQFVMREFDPHGKHTDQISHMLRVYLIDRQKQIRNIYGVSFLHSDLLMNDLETLLLESAGN